MPIPVIAAIAIGVSAAAAVASTVTGIVGSRRNAAAQQQMYQYQANVNKYNQQAYTDNLTIIDESTRLKVYEQRKQLARLAGAQEARASASGITLEGSPTDVMAETMADAELDIYNIKREGALQKRQMLLQAQGQQIDSSKNMFMADQAKSAGAVATTGAVIGGVSNLAGTVLTGTGMMSGASGSTPNSGYGAGASDSWFR